MNVGELRTFLNKFPDDMPIWAQTDQEGNGYVEIRGAELVGLEEDAYGYDTSTCIPEVTNEHIAIGYTKADECSDEATFAVLVYP